MLRRAKRLRYHYFERPAYFDNRIYRSIILWCLASRDFSSRCVIAFEYLDYVLNAKNERRFERFELASDRPVRTEMISACRWKQDTRIKVRMIRGDCNECRVSLWSVWPTIQFQRRRLVKNFVAFSLIYDSRVREWLSLFVDIANCEYSRESWLFECIALL